MKESKGFLVLQEAVLFGLCSLLLVTAASAYASCLRLQEQSMALQKAMEAAQTVLMGDAYTGSMEIRDSIILSSGLEIREVQAGNGKIRCNLLQAVGQKQGLSAGGAANEPGYGGSAGLADLYGSSPLQQ